MSIFKKTEIKTPSRSAVREISATEAKAVGGGINPQPLPPGHRPVETNK